ncbi:MAG: CoA transferase [Chloroflexi bacterium]|nr:CoA transferase [Chloroflexota bacterium]
MRVLELSDRDDAAAYCAKLFGRWGAEVVRVQPPGPPPDRALEIYLHGGKRRVVLDWRDEVQRPQLDALAAGCDVLVTDAPARDLERFRLLELGGEAGPAVRVSITPFGLSGPYRDFEATAAALLALGGYTYLMGDPGRAPLTMPGSYAYYQAATYAYFAALAAYRAGARGSTPRTIEVSVLECLISLHQATDTMWTHGGAVRARHGNRFGNQPTLTLLPCADGWVGFSVGQDFWSPLALMIGHPEFAALDHPWASPERRLADSDAVEDAVREALREWTRERVYREGQETWRVPVGYAVSLGELLEDRHLAARRFWRPVGGLAGPDGSALTVPGSPFRFVGEEDPPERLPLAPESLAEVVADAPARRAEPRLAGAPLPSARPLAGVRVLDLTRIWSGPVATRMLADLGADVIKIEASGGRGPASGRPGAAAAVPGARPWNAQGLFNKLNRNKRSVVLDLKAEEGRRLFLRLVAQSDVVIENFSARAMPGLRLGYEELRAVNESIIYVAMPAFGLLGPYRDYVGLGPSIEPTTGLTALMGYSDGEPRVTAKAVTDAAAGTVAAAAVVTALERRDRTGAGALVDLSQHECGIAIIGEHVIARQLTGEEPRRLGNGHPQCAPHGIYRCAGDDEWIAFAVRDDRDWRALYALAGAGWERDHRFADATSRRAHRLALDAAVERWTVGWEKRALMNELQRRGIAAGAVLSAPEWLEDPHLVARGYFVELPHPEAGRHRSDGLPLVLDGGRGYERWSAAPLLGEHNEAVLGGLLGLSAADVRSLYSSGVIADRPPDI